MKKILVCTASAAAILAATPTVAQSGGAAPRAEAAPQARGKQIIKMERTLTRADAQAKVAEHFARLDTDGDGFVTRAEADSAAQAMRQRMSRRSGEQRTGLFERLDTNNDGTVSRAEANAAHAQLRARAGQQGQSPRRSPGVDRLFTRFDTNRDGSISRAEYDAARSQLIGQHRGGEAREGGHGAGMHGFGGRMFAMADADNDGRVSLAEAQAMALRYFDRVDTNRDGQVTGDERRQFHQRMINERRPG